MTKTTANRVLFTAEKQRTGTGNLALHNDKKWVQEQTQRITEHLLTQNTLGGGISTDFLNRGLKQMSIKQFVAIINYFLGYIWGNRYTVGNNHVDDIIGILQKLQYPHPINKSWLKTPNTQHSFGNVIVLFEFLMDFVPDPTTEEAGNVENFVFDLKEPEVCSNSRMNADLIPIPDLEFQQELLRNSEEGFMLWDKQKEDEFNCLQQQTCNLFIQKTCNFPDLESVDMEIEKLKDILKTLEKETPAEDKEAIKKKSILLHELKKCRRDIKSLSKDCENKERDLKDINSRKLDIAQEVDNVEMEIKSLQKVLTQQKCTVEQRDQLIAEVAQHKQMLAIEQRTIQDLQERNHNQQIQFARSLKHFTDQVESFNKRMREIKFSDLMKSKNITNKDLELSLRPAETTLDNLSKIVAIVIQIQQQTQQRIQQNKKIILHKQQHCKQLVDDLNTKLHPKLNELRSTHTANNSNLQKLKEILKQDEAKLSSSLQQLENELLQADRIIEELKLLINEKTSRVDELKQQNEETMLKAEEKHKECVEQRKSFLHAYDEMLEELLQNDVLQQLKQQVEFQEKLLESFKKDLKNEKK